MENKEDTRKRPIEEGLITPPLKKTKREPEVFEITVDDNKNNVSTQLQVKEETSWVFSCGDSKDAWGIMKKYKDSVRMDFETPLQLEIAVENLKKELMDGMIANEVATSGSLIISPEKMEWFKSLSESHEVFEQPPRYARMTIQFDEDTVDPVLYHLASQSNAIDYQNCWLELNFTEVLLTRDRVVKLLYIIKRLALYGGTLELRLEDCLFDKFDAPSTKLLGAALNVYTPQTLYVNVTKWTETEILECDLIENCKNNSLTHNMLTNALMLSCYEYPVFETNLVWPGVYKLASLQSVGVLNIELEVNDHFLNKLMMTRYELLISYYKSDTFLEKMIDFASKFNARRASPNWGCKKEYYNVTDIHTLVKTVSPYMKVHVWYGGGQQDLARQRYLMKTMRWYKKELESLFYSILDKSVKPHCLASFSNLKNKLQGVHYDWCSKEEYTIGANLGISMTETLV